MAKAKKLKSGSWRCLVYDYTDSNGKRHYESFTADTRREAERLAAEYAATKELKKRPGNMTLYEALDRYIQVKEGVLSPTTVRTYRSARRTHFADIGNRSIRDLTNAMIQVWVSDLAKRLQPKTIANTYGFLSAALDMFYPDLRLKIVLPQKKDTHFYIHSFRFAQGTKRYENVSLSLFFPL